MHFKSILLIMRKKYLLIMSLFVFTFCTEELPEAEFSIYQSSNTTPSTIRLTNQSINADNYKWDYGDGTTSTNKNEFQTHTYYEPGNYTIELKAINDDGEDITSQEIEVLQGTSYRVYNHTSTTLNEVFTFYNSNNSIVDRKDLGRISINSYSKEVLNKKEEISVIFKYENIWFLVVSPFRLYPDVLNTAEINDDTIVLAVTFKSSSNKSNLDIFIKNKDIRFGDFLK